MTYAEFKKNWDQGLVITEDAKHPLKVSTRETAYNAEIDGFLRAAPRAWKR
jgi:hypothetical protein